MNENLQFTHGYGLVMNFVSKTIGGGFPQYLIKNVPPESSYGLNTTQPAIYYGEAMPGSRIVATGSRSSIIPRATEVYTSYAGKGGIPIDSIGQEAVVRLDAGRHQYPAHLLSQAREPDSDLAERPGTRVANRSVLEARRGSLCGLERGQTLLDPGRVHHLGSLSLLESAGSGTAQAD